MCNAIFHPAQTEVKLIEGIYGKGKRREIWGWSFISGGSENLIPIKLAPSIRKPSVSLKNLEWRIKLLMMIVATPVFVEIVGFMKAGSWSGWIALSMCSADPVDHGLPCRWAARRAFEGVCRSHQGRGWIRLMHTCHCESNTIRVQIDDEVVSMGVSPECRPTKTCGRFNEGVRLWSGYFCRIKYKLHWGNLPNDNIWIAGFKLANFII